MDNTPEPTPMSMIGVQKEPNSWAIGFAVFAGILMIVNGFFQIFQGLSAVLQDDFFVLSRAYAYDLDLTAWGWTHIVVGGIVALAGFFLFTGNIIARIVAVLAALLSMVTNFFYLPYYPVWSLLMIAIDIGIIWAVTVHGREIAER
jgi:hypothetical protein